MPRVGKVKIIEGEIWVKVEMDLPSPVTLYTDAELDEIKESVRADIIRAIRDLEL